MADKITNHCDVCGAEIEEVCSRHPNTLIVSIRSYRYRVVAPDGNTTGSYDTLAEARAAAKAAVSADSWIDKTTRVIDNTREDGHPAQVVAVYRVVRLNP